MMMRLLKTSMAVLLMFNVIACQDIVEDINDENPNKISSVDGSTLFTGMILADITAQSGYLNWAAGVWTGNFEGSGRFEPNQNYQYTNTNSNTPWGNIYQGVVKQSRELRSGIPVSNMDFFFGASKVLEAHAVGTAVNVFGKVPFSEAGDNDIPTPKYDEQLEVYNALFTILDEAIFHLEAAGTTGGISEDIFFDGNASFWIGAANTLKSRLYLEIRDYDNAVVSAQNGVSTLYESMRYHPPAVVLTGDTNLLFQFFTGSYSDDLQVEGSFLFDLLGTGSESRNNDKTNEIDRAAYYYDGTLININAGGIGGIDEPMNQISLQENLLTLAEALLRSGASNFNSSLSTLNEHRANLRNGVYFNVSTGVYDDYVEADFLSGGIENSDGTLSKEDALLREILEERYATFFADIISFNDMRRVKKDPVNVQVPIPYKTGSKHPERFLYPFTEENTNGANVPEIVDIFVKTDINQ